MADRVGQQVGNYRLIQLLGSGGFAEVYLAEHQQLGMRAAIKILHAHLESSEISAFRQEARTLADLKHPHIIRVLDFDVQNGTPFLVLDYASKGSLRAIHPRGSKLPLDLVVTYVKPITNALQYAHEHKLIHRDVKPENILLGEHDELLLSDFGIATIAHATSSLHTESSMGTLAYMAPEQIQGKPRPSSDQYALAVTVYHWLTGALPFVGSSAEIIAQHLGAPPPPLRTSVPDLPQDVERVVLTALAKDPQQRFSSMQAFANALALASGLAEVASPLPLASSVQSIEPVVEAPTKPDTLVTVAPRSEVSETLPARPALTPSLASSQTPPVQRKLPEPQMAARRWIIGAVICSLAIILVIGNVWSNRGSNRPGQGSGTLTSPYRLAAGSTDVQNIGITLAAGGSRTDHCPTLTVVSWQMDQSQTYVKLSWQELKSSYRYGLESGVLQGTSGTYSSDSYHSTSHSLSLQEFAAAPQAGQQWAFSMSLTVTDAQNTFWQYCDYGLLYLQF